METGLALFGVACGSNRTLVLVGKQIMQSEALPETK
jgi:hypothetical protein